MTFKTITHGFVRQVSRSLAHCELLHVPRQLFDVDLARQQHGAYVSALVSVGVNVKVLPELADLPDSTFVEDTLVMLDETAVVCRPGAESRRAEVQKMEEQIGKIGPIRRITPPGTLDGGDVMRIGRVLYAGVSSRTNVAGIQQLKEIVARFGYQVITVEVRRSLHLKTAVTSPCKGVVIVNPKWIDASQFRDIEILTVPNSEPWGANTLELNGNVLVSESAPETADLLESRGLRVKRLNISELQKAEAGLTCLSVLYSLAEAC